MVAIIKKIIKSEQVNKKILQFILICDILKNVSYLRILRALAEHESLAVQDFAKILKISHSLASRYLNKLTVNNILVKKEVNNSADYSLNLSNENVVIIKTLLGRINK